MGVGCVMDSIVHFEIPAMDTKRAAEFYNKAFGWQTPKVPDFDYWSLITTASDQKGMPSSPGAINGGMGQKGKMAPDAVTVTIGVADIDKTIANITKLGGKQVGKKDAVGNMGFSAYFKDTEGNVIGLWQSSRGM